MTQTNRPASPALAAEQFPHEFAGTCCICGEALYLDEDVAEMHDGGMRGDPEMWSEAEGGTCHAECGLGKGWVIS